MMLSEVLQSQEAAPVVTEDAPVALYLRVVTVVMHALVKRDGEQEGLENPRARALLREVGVVESSTAGGAQALMARLDDHVAEQVRMQPDAGPAIGELAIGLSQVFGYGISERQLLELSLHANRSRKVQRAMNLVGEVDDEEAAQLFADILDLEQEAVLIALRRSNPFRRMQPFDVMHGQATPFSFIKFTSAATNVVRNTPKIDRMLALFCRPSPKAKLAIADFHHQADELDLLRRYLQRALASSRPAVNILLHGAPGTGKTELVRTLAASLDGQLVEVPAVDEDKDPLPPWKRLTALTATQEVMRTHGSALVLFDEVEVVFPLDGGPFGGHRGRSGSDRHKAWLTQMLEENTCPTFWVCNEISHIDPAYIRRFDMVVELSAPSRAARECLIDALFAGIPLKHDALEGLKSEVALAPAHLERIAGVLKTIAPANDEDAGALLGMLECQTRKALDLPARPRATGKGMPYRQDCINTNVDLEAVATALESQPAARLCLFGPPGTGKTEWARQLARRLGRPLHVKRASDLLSKFVGDSERLMRQTFDVAARESAVLLIDEADGLLRDRMSASHGWEVSMINELLTCIETFEGIFIASTNLQERLDQASARRFDFKVSFDYLSVDQAGQMFHDLLQALGIELDAGWVPPSSALSRLAPGDFANVFRQARLVPATSAEKLVELLAKEAAAGPFRKAKQAIGFIRDVG
jgi:SpoVK/Ycf46/Vps4 family AAA+-type ATPase